MAITSADAIILLSAPGVFPIPQQLEQFGVDSAVLSDSMKLAETRLGVDGKLTAGKIPAIIPITVNLMADSPSLDIFNLLLDTQGKQGIIKVDLVITLISTGRIYRLNEGFFTEGKIMPDLKKILEEQSFKLEFPSKKFSIIGV